MLNRPFQVRTGFSRRLGLLLVAFILYGTTVEAAHRHGRVLTDKCDIASVTHSEPSGNLTGAQTGCSDCLICQLHQNFSTTLITVRLINPPARILFRTTAVVAPDVLSQITSPLSGRAPPFIS